MKSKNAAYHAAGTVLNHLPIFIKFYYSHYDLELELFANHFAIFDNFDDEFDVFFSYTFLSLPFRIVMDSFIKISCVRYVR